MESKTNIFEKISLLLPGYKGYNERDNKRNSDKILRDYIFIEISKLIKEILFNVDDNYLGDDINKINFIIKKLKKIQDNIRFTEYGHSSLFSQYKIELKDLEKIYNVDFKMLEKVKLLETFLIEKDFMNIETTIKDLEDMLKDRYILLKGNI